MKTYKVNKTALPVPGKASYATLQEVVNEFSQNYSAIRRIGYSVYRKRCKKYEPTIRKARAENATVMFELETVPYMDGYVFDYGYFIQSRGETMTNHWWKECAIDQRYDHLTLTDIWVHGKKDPEYVFFTDEFLGQWTASTGKGLGSLLRINGAHGYNVSHIKVDTATGEVKWSFHAGEAIGHVEDDCYVFDRLIYNWYLDYLARIFLI